MDQNREKQDDYNALDASEQKTIRFLLDCAASPPGFLPIREPEWLEEYGWNRPGSEWVLARTVAAYDCLRKTAKAASKLADATSWTDGGLNETIFFGEAVLIGRFCIRNQFIRTFRAFDFLFVRLFGGMVRPLTPSLFAAALLHPDITFEAVAVEELENAIRAREQSWGTHGPVWFPNHPISALQPIRARQSQTHDGSRSKQ